ncbi:DUF4878 domain-containing protein [Kingella kingae]|uniref:DUF4878 domain-containing protein n=1 Tax=Kingella kingae TaxID=504 RepID=UPI0025511305|nr:DUF4878 domain-containing protein [Kingella kingae]MDK4535449.1 DUF4878 domain-containing protein [Kingella kingae]MDK4537984.1 DUF4878 domain-containing protein [Kingella kingae]MDK4546336.1 DUF4878 domain-containing protein [Kingella kingae]MDK4622176.1 DUF4878 domain-containing protein [Kingella kingae]MDK4642152.1 DUF4878 domain-containing protein [Kingella kingae]
MQKMFKWFAVAVVSGMLAACGGGSSSPESAAQTFVEKSYQGDADAVIAMIHIPEEDKKPGVEEVISGKIKAGVAEQKDYAEKQNGVAEITTEPAQVSPNDSKRATVNVQIKFKNDKTRQDRVRLIEVDGNWKINL